MLLSCHLQTCEFIFLSSNEFSFTRTHTFVRPFQASKCLKKGVEDSLKTATKNRSEDLESRKKRTAEYALGETVAQAVHCLNETSPIITTAHSPLNTIMERFGNLEKTLGHMIATNEAEIYAFMAQGSDTPMSKLLGKGHK